MKLKEAQAQSMKGFQPFNQYLTDGKLLDEDYTVREAIQSFDGFGYWNSDLRAAILLARSGSLFEITSQIISSSILK